MPDPNNNQTTTPPLVTPTTDLPPMMPDMSMANTPTPPPQVADQTVTTSTLAGSAAPPVTFPELKVEEPKKKFGGGKGKIIATILGILLLVGGVSTGVYLSLNNQNPQEKAASCPSECRKGPSCGAGYSSAGGCGGCPIGAGGVPQVCCAANSCGGGTTGGTGCNSNTSSTSCNSACSPGGYKCKWLSASSSCSDSNTPCGSTGGTGTTTIVACGTPGSVQCGKTPDGTCGGFCINPIDKTCDDMLLQQCNFTPIRGANYVAGSNKASCPTGYQSAFCTCTSGGKSYGACFDRGFDGTNTSGVPNGTANQCGTPDGSDQTGLCAVYVNSQKSGGPAGALCGTKVTYYCPGVDYTKTGQSCTGTTTKPANFCGTTQVDTYCQGYQSTYTPCTSPTPKPTPTPSPSPSPTPVPVAQCQNVTAYSTTWSVLSATQLSALKAGSVVNFCVVGSASAGSFDMAKFTINSVAQAQTTTHRPNTQDYCQSYTIPAATYSFDVTAQIHHVTLGWK